MRDKLNKIKELLVDKQQTVILYESSYRSENTWVLVYSEYEDSFKIYSGYGDNIQDKLEYNTIEELIEEAFDSLDKVHIFVKYNIK